MLQQQQLQNLIKKLTGCLVTSYNSNLWACERRIFNENLPSSYLNLSDENTPNLYDERVKEMISHELIKWLMSRIWQHSGNKQNIPPKSSMPSAFFNKHRFSTLSVFSHSLFTSKSLLNNALKTLFIIFCSTKVVSSKHFAIRFITILCCSFQCLQKRKRTGQTVEAHRFSFVSRRCWLLTPLWFLCV